MDFRFIISTFLLLGSFIASVLGVVPAWQSISETIAAKRTVEKNVRDLDGYFLNFSKLKKDIKESLTFETCTRLNNIAPAVTPSDIDLPQLMLQFNNLALAHNTQMSGFSIGEPNLIDPTDSTSLKQETIAVTMPIGLDAALAFLEDVYYIERIVDIQSVKISTSGAADNSVASSGLSTVDAVVYSSIRNLDCTNLTK